MTRVSVQHRRLVVLRGTPRETADAAHRCVADLEYVLHVTDASDAPPGAVSTRRLQKLLGRSYDAVVLDLHQDIDPDTLGRAHGFVWGGGALVLRLPPSVEDIPPPQRLAVSPYEPRDVGNRFRQRLESCLQRAVTQSAAVALHPCRNPAGTSEQAEVVDKLTAVIEGSPGECAVLVADRGRGKSSALGLALHQVEATRRIALTGPVPDAVGEVLRFAGGRVSYVEPRTLAASVDSYDVVVVDEAAQLPIPWLRELVISRPQTRFVFATTTHGYEGTGRGFALRFVHWLACHRTVTRLTLSEPIRWASGDPLESFVFEALLLDADIVTEDGSPNDSRTAAVSPFTSCDGVETVDFDRDTLAGNSALLRQFFGLLVQAHYRTTPGDLERILDAPNVRLHAVMKRDIVLAATVVGLEGELDPLTVDDMYRGRTRIRGHALPDTFVTHLGHPEAGALAMVRSVRIAVHPDFRRQGVGTRLVEHVHEVYEPDLFGTMFGATAELVEFRRQSGYEIVRLGGSRGARTGEPAVVMARPVSEPATELVERLRAGLARDLPLQLELLAGEGEPPFASELRASLFRDLGAPAELSYASVMQNLRDYIDGPRTFESVATSVDWYVQNHPAAVDALDEKARRLVRERVERRTGWRTAANQGRYSSVRAAMRALRVAVGVIVQAAEKRGDPM